MKAHNHWNILVPNGAGKEDLIKAILSHRLLGELASEQIALYSPMAIKKYLREEEVHDLYIISNERGQTLQSMSSGERKKALLMHLINQQPSALLLDNPLDSLDQPGRAELLRQIKGIAQQASIINIVSRTRDFIALEAIALVYKDQTLSAYQKDEALVSKVWLEGKLPEPFQQAAGNTDELILMRDVHVRYGERPILSGISWRIAAGEFWQLKGPNGTGKTTLLTMITGDNHKAYGQDIRLFGYQKGSGESVWDIKKNIGYYTSNMAHDFWRNQTIAEMIISGYFDSVGLYVRPSDLQLRRTNEWLELIGLSDQRDKPFVHLPAGWQRLVLIIRAMVKHPPLLILDEPTSDLDDANVVLITGLINKIARESNTAILYVSHQDEKGLSPDYQYILAPSQSGSTGKVIKSK
ncbi:MAG: ATP-binding cassette domain-containing protein [Marinoscillum sp.]